MVAVTKPSHSHVSTAAQSRPYGWLEVLAMKDHYGIRADPLAEPAKVEATVVQRLYLSWINGTDAEVWPLRQMFYALRAEYRHLNREQRAEKLPRFILAALNDPHGGIHVVPLPDCQKRAA